MEQVVYDVHANDSEEVLDCGLLDLPWDVAELVWALLDIIENGRAPICE